jgi:hypothetical protein
MRFTHHFGMVATVLGGLGVVVAILSFLLIYAPKRNLALTLPTERAHTGWISLCAAILACVLTIPILATVDATRPAVLVSRHRSAPVDCARTEPPDTDGACDETAVDLGGVVDDVLLAVEESPERVTAPAALVDLCEDVIPRSLERARRARSRVVASQDSRRSFDGPSWVVSAVEWEVVRAAGESPVTSEVFVAPGEGPDTEMWRLAREASPGFELTLLDVREIESEPTMTAIPLAIVSETGEVRAWGVVGGRVPGPVKLALRISGPSGLLYQHSVELTSDDADVRLMRFDFSCAQCAGRADLDLLESVDRQSRVTARATLESAVGYRVIRVNASELDPRAQELLTSERPGVREEIRGLGLPELQFVPEGKAYDVRLASVRGMVTAAKHGTTVDFDGASTAPQLVELRNLILGPNTIWSYEAVSVDAGTFTLPSTLDAGMTTREGPVVALSPGKAISSVSVPGPTEARTDIGEGMFVRHLTWLAAYAARGQGLSSDAGRGDSSSNGANPLGLELPDERDARVVQYVALLIIALTTLLVFNARRVQRVRQDNS